MAHSVISEEKAEQASGKPELDLKVDSSAIHLEDNTSAPPSEQSSSEESHSEQDRILKHQQEIESLAVSRSEPLDTASDSSLHRLTSEIEADQIISHQENSEGLRVLMAQESKEKEVMAAAGETQDGSVRQNDHTTKKLLDDIGSEESVVQAESLSAAPSQEVHPTPLDTEILGEYHKNYQKNLKNLMDETETDSTLMHLESSPAAEEPEDHSSYKSSMRSLMSDTMMDQHLSSLEAVQPDEPAEDHSSYKGHLKNLVSDTEMNANLEGLEGHGPAEVNLLQTESEAEAMVDAQIQANMQIS
jgi:hypothetical protein